jgi:hypothetical protein
MSRLGFVRAINVHFVRQLLHYSEIMQFCQDKYSEMILICAKYFAFFNKNPKRTDILQGDLSDKNIFFYYIVPCTKSCRTGRIPDHAADTSCIRALRAFTLARPKILSDAICLLFFELDVF